MHSVVVLVTKDYVGLKICYTNKFVTLPNALVLYFNYS